MEEFKSECRKTVTSLAPLESPLPLETMSQFAEPVIPEGAKRLPGIQRTFNDVTWCLVPRLRGDVVWIPARVPLCETRPG
jgi:hypothetical protein